MHDLKSLTLPKFKSSAGSKFYFELKQNVESYFKENNISKFGNTSLITKTALLLVGYFGVYFTLLFVSMPLWSMWILSAFLGVIVAGIGMGVMHDANHGSFSKNGTINKIFGRTADMLGVSSNNWINQHNKLHHTYTNIYEHDEDVNGKGLFRFSPDAPRRKIHRLQHVYWTFFYGFLTLGWFFADMGAYKKYRDRGLNRSKGAKMRKEVGEIIFFKVFYVLYILVIPMLVMDIAWWQVIIGFISMHFVAGMILSLVFQMAHVVDKFDISQHDKFEGETKEEWAVHQINNTFDFATQNKFVTWYCGGLNYQIEHHLFPNISHVHYPKLHKIIKSTALKHGINYQEFTTFREAFASHLTFLRKLGRPVPHLAR